MGLKDMYNVLAKLRSGEPLSAKEKATKEQGLVSVLRQPHYDLDAFVAEAGRLTYRTRSSLRGRWP